MTETLGAHAGSIGATVIRDGAFASLGLLSHHGERMLAYVQSPAWLPALASNPAIAAVITIEALASDIPSEVAVAVAPDPMLAFYRLHERLLRAASFYGAPVPTVIASTALVDPRVVIPAADVRIGERAIIEPFVVIQGRVSIEDDAVVRAGSVLGADGFQVVTSASAPLRIAHAGAVRVERGAEIRAHCCIDRALFGGETRVGEGATLDHFVYVAHDVTIGARCRVGAGAIINGTVAIGEDAWIGPGATLRDGIAIGRGAAVSLGSVVTLDVPPGGRVTGNFAVPHEEFLRSLRKPG